MTPDTPTELRHGAEALASGLPPLLAEARQLAAAVHPGAHGRRRAGVGDEFWQYRPAMPFDEARSIDWRRSARSDQHFIREKEWQATQSVHLWVDPSKSMEFHSSEALPKKADRARLLALAVAILLERAGEKVGLADGTAPPQTGRAQLTRLALALAGGGPAQGDYGAPSATSLFSGARVIFLSDFLGDYPGVEATVLAASDRGISGALLQILDPVEESFPFAGRAIFESMGGGISHETREAAGLRARYLERLAERKDRLAAIARQTGWVWSLHHTDQAAATALLWLYQAIGQRS